MAFAHLYPVAAFVAVLFLNWLAIHWVSRWIESRAIAKGYRHSVERK